MAPMQQVGSRELKNRLGHYLRIVRNGGRLLVTDRGCPVAELSPVGEKSGGVEAIDALLGDLARTGEVTLPEGHGFQAVRPVRRPDLTLSDAVVEDRR